jgi:hypothetical protein
MGHSSITVTEGMDVEAITAFPSAAQCEDAGVKLVRHVNLDEGKQKPRASYICVSRDTRPLE